MNDSPLHDIESTEEAQLAAHRQLYGPPEGSILFCGLARIGSCDTGNFVSTLEDVWKETTSGKWVRLKIHRVVAVTLYRALGGER